MLARRGRVAADQFSQGKEARARLEDFYGLSGDLRLGTFASEEDWEFIRKRYGKSLFQHGVKKRSIAPPG